MADFVGLIVLFIGFSKRHFSVQKLTRAGSIGLGGTLTFVTIDEKRR